MKQIFKPADILIPQNADYKKWAVVACDQYSSQREYWDAVKKIVGSAPSTYNIIFPEAYLEDGDGDERIKNINANMEKYLAEGIFKEYKDTFILVERKQSNGKIRKGIIGMMDLEEYDYSKGSQSKIRATEGTIIERIPPRQKIRINAPLELPHILMLIDDREKSVIEPVSEAKDTLEKLYDFELMMDGGHIEGYKVTEELKEQILDSLDALADQSLFEEKYGVKNKGLLLYAAGDGNHSLATAKSCWDEIKKNLSDEEIKTHPARFALVELNNIHDDALEFEPIQRIIFNTDPKKLLDELKAYYPQSSCEDNGGQKIRYTYQGNEGTIYIKSSSSNLAVGTLQIFLDKYIAENGGEIDYIHGDDVVKDLAQKGNSIGFMVDAMEKNDLFTTVIMDGSLPRKTFSMGEAADKRFYLECKKIR